MHNVWNNFYRTKEFVNISPVFRTFLAVCAVIWQRRLLSL